MYTLVAVFMFNLSLTSVTTRHDTLTDCLRAMEKVIDFEKNTSIKVKAACVEE